MKIGILTYHRSHNYGALLQAFALKYFLLENGFKQVEFVDYYPEYHYRMYSNIKRKSFKRLNTIQKIKYPLYFLRDFYPIYTLKEKRRKSFLKFIKKYIICTNNGTNNANYDVVIYGSDQIWRKQKQKECPGFNHIYFGTDTIKSKKRIAFSASMGIIEVSEDDIAFLKQSLANFSAISVREIDLFNLLNPISNSKISITLDPVFLLNQSNWDKIIPKRQVKDKFVLLYNLQHNNESRNIAYYIADKLNYEVIELIGAVQKIKYSKNVRPTDGPESFLSLLKYADFIVTSSFHGVAFSIIFKKQFYACLSINTSRVSSILSTFNLEDRMIDNLGQINLKKCIDYKKINLNIQTECNRSKEFLLNTINN